MHYARGRILTKVPSSLILLVKNYWSFSTSLYSGLNFISLLYKRTCENHTGIQNIPHIELCYIYKNAVIFKEWQYIDKFLHNVEKLRVLKYIIYNTGYSLLCTRTSFASKLIDYFNIGYFRLSVYGQGYFWVLVLVPNGFYPMHK